MAISTYQKIDVKEKVILNKYLYWYGACLYHAICEKPKNEHNLGIKEFNNSSKV